MNELSYTLKIEIKELRKKANAEMKEFNAKLDNLEYQINEPERYSTISNYIGKYLALSEIDFKTSIEQELCEDKIILYKRLQNNLTNSAAFKKGGTPALKRTLEKFIEQGFLIEIDKDEMKATYGTAQRAFKIL